MFPKIFDSNGVFLATLDNIIQDSALIKRVINGEFTFEFEAFEKELKSEYFQEDNIIVIDGQSFDISYIEQQHTTEVKYKLKCEHVNYRLLDGEQNYYNSYAFIGTPTQILTDILQGTDFSVGQIDYNQIITITANDITKKELIYELANLLGGEIEYTNEGWTFNILNTIGQDNGFQVRFGKNLKGITKIIDRRENVKTAYQVDIVELKNSSQYKEAGLSKLETIGIGDTVRVIDEVINLDIQNRIVSIEYNPIFAINTNLEIANTIELVTDKINQIETNITQLDKSVVHQDIVYNGVSISSDEGFVVNRSDNKAKALLNATEGISIYSDKGSGLEKNFYVDLDGRIKGKGLDIDGTSTFNGVIKANQILIGGDNGYISFHDLSDKPNYLQETYIDQTSIQSPNIYGGTIQGVVIIGSTMIAGESSQIRLHNNDYHFGAIEFLAADYIQASIYYKNTLSELCIDASGRQITLDASYIFMDSDVLINGNVEIENGSLSVNGWPIATQSWVIGNFSPNGHTHNYAPISHDHGNNYVKSYTGQNLSLVATETGIIVRVNGVTLGSIFYD